MKGGFLGVVGLSSLYGFSRLDIKESETVEQRMEQLKKIESGDAPFVSPGAPIESK